MDAIARGELFAPLATSCPDALPARAHDAARTHHPGSVSGPSPPPALVPLRHWQRQHPGLRYHKDIVGLWQL